MSLYSQPQIITSLWLVLIFRPTEDRRLSGLGDWLHYDAVCPPEDGYPSQYQPTDNAAAGVRTQRSLSRKSDALTTRLLNCLGLGVGLTTKTSRIPLPVWLLLRNDSVQAIHTLVPVSSRSITRRSRHSEECKHPRRHCFCVSRDLDLGSFDPKTNGFPGLTVDHF